MKNIANKTKMSLWDEIKEAAKVAIPVSLLTTCALNNVMGYITTQYDINRMKTPEAKEIMADIKKEVFQEVGPIVKVFRFGDYLAADEYLRNNQ